MENRSLVTIAEHSKEKILYLLEMAKEFEKCPNRKILDGKIRTALVAGCGGAGKAAAVAATDLGLDTILMNRTLDKAEKTAEEIGNLTVEPLSSFPKCFHDADLIIYTLPAPVDSIASQQPNGQPGMKILLEANYRNPSFGQESITEMAAENNGFKYVPGTRWLLYQAYAGYDLFTGKEPDLEAMAQVVRKPDSAPLLRISMRERLMTFEHSSTKRLTVVRAIEVSL